MRTRLALLLAGALVLGACSQSDDASSGATDAPSASATETSTEAATGGATEAPTDGAAEAELVSEDLPDGVAATVGGTEIPVQDLEERLALVREIPQVQQQLEGEQGDQAEAQIQSQVLGQLVLQEVVLQGAAEEGVEVGDERVADDRASMQQEAGGEEAFAEQLANAGVPETQLDEELRASIAFELVTEKLLAEAEPAEGGTASEGATDGATEGTEAPTDSASPSGQTQQVQQQWLLELVSGADVVVDEAYGAWNPSTGQVVPG